MRLFHKSTRPLYLGEISVSIGYSLVRTHEFVSDLILSGKLRNANQEDLKIVDGRPGDTVFALVGRPDLSKAYIP